jgi:hypothetical protein
MPALRNALAPTTHSFLKSSSQAPSPLPQCVTANTTVLLLIAIIIIHNLIHPHVFVTTPTSDSRSLAALLIAHAAQLLVLGLELPDLAILQDVLIPELQVLVL